MSDRFTRYLDAVAGRPPRDTLLQALAGFPADGRQRLAVDLGCGDGRDTVALLQAGWRVLAIDSSAEAIRRLRARAGTDPLLEIRHAAFEDARWPAVDLVNSSFALPFCRPDAFAALWQRIVGGLRPGGRFAGQLFGPHDDWAGSGIVVCTQAEVRALLDGFEVERLDELDEDGETATGEAKHWHLFHVVARKPLRVVSPRLGRGAARASQP